MPWTDEEVARVAVANQLRRGHHALLGGDHEPSTLNDLAEALDAALSVLDGAPPRPPILGKWADPSTIMVPDDGEAFLNSVNRPVSGHGNPWSIPLDVVRQGELAVTVVELGSGYEGAPDRSHGGVVSAIFDDLCGFLLTLHKSIAFTASLTINYKAGTPLHVPITFSAGIDRAEGRKLFMKGECRAGSEDADGELLTTCEALFITVNEMPPASE